ncbi:uncharacterized protein LOC144448708 [Glandiceps talaboti]
MAMASSASNGTGAIIGGAVGTIVVIIVVVIVMIFLCRRKLRELNKKCRQEMQDPDFYANMGATGNDVQHSDDNTRDAITDTQIDLCPAGQDVNSDNTATYEAVGNEILTGGQRSREPIKIASHDLGHDELIANEYAALSVREKQVYQSLQKN